VALFQRLLFNDQIHAVTNTLLILPVAIVACVMLLSNSVSRDKIMLVAKSLFCDFSVFYEINTINMMDTKMSLLIS